MRTGFGDSGNTACLDVDWVMGGCMSVDPRHTIDPFRVDCNDKSVPHCQRATYIVTGLKDPVSVGQCISGAALRLHAARIHRLCRGRHLAPQATVPRFGQKLQLGGVE
jgi:hypothetical protein